MNEQRLREGPPDACSGAQRVELRELRERLALALRFVSQLHDHLAEIDDEIEAPSRPPTRRGATSTPARPTGAARRR